MDSVCYSGMNIIFFSFLPIEKKKFSYRLLGIFYGNKKTTYMNLNSDTSIPFKGMILM